LSPIAEFLRTLVGLAKFTQCVIYNREVILDVSSTVVDESKEIVLVEFASLSNAALRMICISINIIHLGMASQKLFVAMVTVVDSQARGICVEAKYTLLEYTVRLFYHYSPDIQYI